MLKNVLADYRANAELCSEKAKLGFPRSWHTASSLTTRVLGNIDRLFALHRKAQVDRFDGEKLQMPVLRPILKDLEAVLDEVHGLMDTVVALSERLSVACQEQLAALQQLEEASRGRDPAQAYRIASLGRRAVGLLVPILEASYVIGPANRCIHAGCKAQAQIVDLMERNLYFTWVALLASIFAALYQSRIVNLMIRGLFLICPCLETL